jgi:nitrogen regulatory protein P-II 2
LTRIETVIGPAGRNAGSGAALAVFLAVFRCAIGHSIVAIAGAPKTQSSGRRNRSRATPLTAGKRAGRARTQRNSLLIFSPICRYRRREEYRGTSMKLVTAVIKPFKLEDVRDALTSLGVAGLTVSEVKGFGRQKGHTEIYRGAEYTVNFLPKVKVEVVVPSDRAARVVEAIQAAAKTGQIGDGKIFVLDVDHAVRIRTGETDSDAL